MRIDKLISCNLKYCQLIIDLILKLNERIIFESVVKQLEKITQKVKMKQTSTNQITLKFDPFLCKRLTRKTMWYTYEVHVCKIIILIFINSYQVMTAICRGGYFDCYVLTLLLFCILQLLFVKVLIHRKYQGSIITDKNKVTSTFHIQIKVHISIWRNCVYVNCTLSNSFQLQTEHSAVVNF